MSQWVIRTSYHITLHAHQKDLMCDTQRGNQMPDHVSSGESALPSVDPCSITWSGTSMIPTSTPSAICTQGDSRR